ncbi:uncharacterized protein LOC126278580 [Schistocerca gregaria]|uniref:uncharacterized protein LOC126278580 n=1 Tax=Schistocerca gregaria TaxID=7010 RepID=UPI00211E9DED|nr:uncharacterized protein LOC126278580 [Schistocerca gregaria]
MLRAAATVVALLAALPVVTPLLGGYRTFTECRNLTHLGPGEWPEFPPRRYNFTGLLVMPGDTCTCFLLNSKIVISSSLCRLWKGNVDFSNDIEEDGSEIRIGLIQGEVSEHFYRRELVKRYWHVGKSEAEIRRTPLMVIETQRGFRGVSHHSLPGVFRSSPFQDEQLEFISGEVIGYEHSVNLPVYHQAAYDAHFYRFNRECRKYGRTQWDLTESAFCTWDVSPVRTVCKIDRGAPVLFRRQFLGFVVGIVDDMQRPGNYCGEGRIHYNVFDLLPEYMTFLKAKTGGKMKIVTLADGRVTEESEDVTEPGSAKPIAGRAYTTKRTYRHRAARGGTESHMVSQGLLLLTAVGPVAHLASQY